MATKKQADYQTLSAELDGVLAALQQPSVQVDEAVRLYEQGLKLVAACEAHLAQAENKLTKLKLAAQADED
jgi:exodeoxyribonuclease VII small subunit